jgi:hypothetical protein
MGIDSYDDFSVDSAAILSVIIRLQKHHLLPLRILQRQAAGRWTAIAVDGTQTYVTHPGSQAPGKHRPLPCPPGAARLRARRPPR